MTPTELLKTRPWKGAEVLREALHDFGEGCRLELDGRRYERCPINSGHRKACIEGTWRCDHYVAPGAALAVEVRHPSGTVCWLKVEP